METRQQECFDDVQFGRFLEYKTDADEEARVLLHIETCEQCQSALERLAGHEKVWSEIKHHLAEERPDFAGEETREHLELRDRQRDLKAIERLLGPTDNPEMLGRISGYEVCGMIGRGSAGVVVKALDKRLNRFVAIKLLAPAYSNNGSSRRRFEREGRAIASVKDPNVIPVHTVGEYQGTPYIVMQYVPDGSLQQRIDTKGPLEPSEVVCVGMQIAKGLAAAHKRGIVHRDVKPANVLLESGVDAAMVTDFGLARVVDEATMTRSGAISGTPQYMSPEQAKGETVDPRSDLFSLGSVMYAACTGHSPFRAESVFGVIKRVCDSEPRPIRETSPDIPEWLTAFITKLQSKRIENRFDSADEVAELLSQELAHMQSPTLVVKPSRGWWKKPVPPVKVVEKSKPGPRSRRFGPKMFFGGVIAVAVCTLIVLTISGMTDSGGDKGIRTTSTAGGAGNYGPWTSLLAITKQENEDMPRFKNTVETTIDVKNGGQLVLQTNLGALDIVTHDKPTIEMKLVHTVSAVDQETANKLFKAMKIEYKLDADDKRRAAVKKGRDAVIVATFPTRKLTQEEIEESTDLEELKEQLLIRNNSHFRNAEFELRVPTDFNLDLETNAGPIDIADINGSAKCFTSGGSINAGNFGADASLHTSGGHIEIGGVKGNLVAKTNGGHIRADDVSGTADVLTNGGKIELGRLMKSAKAVSNGGGIKIWKADADVQADAPSGSITINFTTQPTGDSKLTAGSGSIRIGYVKEMSFDINASCGLGKVSGPFAHEKTQELQYSLNNGKSKLTATTGKGSIKFRTIDPDQLDQEYREMVEQSRGRRAFDRAYDTHMAGDIDKALRLHAAAAKYDNFKGIATYNIGCAWALKENKDNAFEALNDAVTFGFDDVGQFKSDSDLDSLRKDERFAELMARVKGQVKKEEY